MERVAGEEEGPWTERPYGVDPNRLYTMGFVADLLSVDKKLVRWWIKRGVLEGIKLPNRAWRVRGIEIIRIIDQGRSPGHPLEALNKRHCCSTLSRQQGRNKS